jgi:L-lactate dehydrogenase
METFKPKIAIVGSGSVGSTYAYSLMISGLAREIVLIDQNEMLAKGECMDLNHGISFVHQTKIYAAGFEGCNDADIVIITAGAEQKMGQSRTELAIENVAVFKEIIPEITKYAKNAILLVVSNPVDILTYITLKISGFPANRVLGTGTVLDTKRFKFMISESCKVDIQNVHAYIIGEHGDSEFPVWSNATISGIEIEKYCTLYARLNNGKNELAQLFINIKNSAYEIIKAKGVANYSIALAILRITKAIVRNENSILPVSTHINDYYTINDICISIPAIVNKQGVEQFLKLELSEHEQSLFQHSAETIKMIIKQSMYTH